MDFDLPIETGQSFEERIGKPNKFDAAMGRIVQSFSFLEDTLSNIISILLKFDGDLVNIITAELSFRNKVSLFSSLYKHFQDTYEPVNEETDKHFQELLKALNKANELRNRIIHSRYILNRFRIKITSKGKKGLKKSIEKISPDYLLDISDYISEAAMALEEFPLHLGIADQIRGDGKELVYYKESKILYKFSFDIET
jgi:pyruvate formate-lyase activating enzyme-like uncharacterized protein